MKNGLFKSSHKCVSVVNSPKFVPTTSFPLYSKKDEATSSSYHTGICLRSVITQSCSITARVNNIQRRVSIAL